MTPPLADGIDTWATLNMICIHLEAVVDEFRPLSGNSRGHAVGVPWYGNPRFVLAKALCAPAPRR